ncbi:MAG: hypothetical protein R2861_05960 [Desulfobacterales bacterium]
MNQEVDEKITAIRLLQTAGLKVAHKQNVLRTRLKNGYLVDVFTLKNTPDRIRADQNRRAGSSKRQAQVTSTHLAFSEVLAGIVQVAPFCLSRESDSAHIFLADLTLKRRPLTEPILMTRPLKLGKMTLRSLKQKMSLKVRKVIPPQCRFIDLFAGNGQTRQRNGS